MTSKFFSFIKNSLIIIYGIEIFKIIDGIKINLVKKTTMMMNHLSVENVQSKVIFA